MYYNPACSKCLYALDYLAAHGITPARIAYLEQAPSAAELKTLAEALGLPVMQLVRTSEPLYMSQFSHKSYTDEEWLDILAANPVLLQRPILVKAGKAVIGRTPESLSDFIQ